MGILQTIGNIVKAILLFASLWSEKNKRKAEEKKKIADEITAAFKQTNRHLRASHLNAAIGKLRK